MVLYRRSGRDRWRSSEPHPFHCAFQSAPGQTMAALLLIPFVFFSFILCEQVSPPLNLNIQGVNTNYILQWQWAGMDRQTANFTVQWIGNFQFKWSRPPKWRPACKETSNMFCDLTPLNLLYLGIFTLRVRANVNGHHSEWAQVDFAPAHNADVGPPSIMRVSPVDDGLEVSILEPQTSNNTSMKDKILSLHYRFWYWEQHANHKRSDINSTNTIVVLKNLKSRTLYCVSVQSKTIEPNRTSAFSDPVCISTQGGFDWGMFFIIFVSSLFLVVVIVLVTLLGSYYIKKKVKTSVAPPAFLDKDWHFPPMLVTSDLLSEQCEHLTVRSPSQERVHSSERPERQTSSDSEDSGVYTSNNSTSDQSTQLQHVGQSGVQETCLTPKHVQLIQDEGFGDITDELRDLSLTMNI